LEQYYYPGAYYTVCLVDSPEVHLETAQEKRVRKEKEKVEKLKKKK
jgi:hypothetical protein